MASPLGIALCLGVLLLGASCLLVLVFGYWWGYNSGYWRNWWFNATEIAAQVVGVAYAGNMVGGLDRLPLPGPEIRAAAAPHVRRAGVGALMAPVILRLLHR